MTTLQKIYSDIDFTFLPKPVVKDIALSYDTQAIIRSIRNLLLTNYYERPFNPDLGSSLNATLFENISDVSAAILENTISTTIKNYEPRAILKDINVNPLPDQNAYSVTISFYTENNATATSITLLLERDR